MTDPHHARDGLLRPHDMDEQNQDDNPLLTLSEAGKLLGVSHVTIAKWIDAGLPAIQMPDSSRRRVYRRELLDFVDSHRLSGESSESSADEGC